MLLDLLKATGYLGENCNDTPLKVSKKFQMSDWELLEAQNVHY